MNSLFKWYVSGIGDDCGSFTFSKYCVTTDSWEEVQELEREGKALANFFSHACVSLSLLY